MAESLYKVATQGTSGGNPIYDVFEGDRKLELPEFQQRGLNIDQIQLGQAPTGFTSQFQPVEIPPMKAPDLEEAFGATQNDTIAAFEAGRAKQGESRTRVAELERATERETSLMNDIEELEEMLRQGVQQVQDRPLDGTVLRSGIAAEINNITQGNTKESLAILRSIDTKTRLLTVEQRKRQQEISVEKLKLERDEFNEDSLLKIDQLNRQMRTDAENAEDRLDEKQNNYLQNTTSGFVGLTFDELTPEQQRMVAQQANKLDPTGTLLAQIRNRMQVEKNELELKELNTRSLIADRGNNNGGGANVTIGGKTILDSTANVIEGAQNLADLSSSEKTKSIAELRELGFYSTTPPEWFRKEVEQQKQASVTPEELAKLWEENRQSVIEEKGGELDFDNL